MTCPRRGALLAQQLQAETHVLPVFDTLSLPPDLSQVHLAPTHAATGRLQPPDDVGILFVGFAHHVEKRPRPLRKSTT
jgi:hypothetical protein